MNNNFFKLHMQYLVKHYKSNLTKKAIRTCPFLQKIIIMITIIEQSYSIYNTVSVREELWVNSWLVSHAENVIRGAYGDCGHLNCYVVGVRFFNA